jgi:hypothetical protein
LHEALEYADQVVRLLCDMERIVSTALVTSRAHCSRSAARIEFFFEKYW